MRLVETVERTWKADVEAMRNDFALDLLDDGIDTANGREVVEACWKQGLREPYFELQDETVSDMTVYKT